MVRVLLGGVLSVVSALTAFGGTITVPSTRDEATGQWIGDVTGENGLTNALGRAKSGDVVALSKGIYDLTALAAGDFVMRKGDSTSQSYAVGSIISAMAEGVTLKGETGDPADVLIKVDDNEKYRIYHPAKNGKVFHVTMTGGTASSTCCGGYNFRSGGAIGMASDVVVSNCVFYGNKAARHGGAVGGGTAKIGQVWNCVFYGNNNGSTGSAGAYTTFHNCVFSNNQVMARSDSNSAGTVYSCDVYDCFFTNNMANGSGGVSGGNVYNSKFIDNHDVSGNYGNAGGGGAHGCTVVSNCYFYGNTTQRLGGAVRGGLLIDCVVVSNRTRSADAPAGGGVYEATGVINCLVVSNYTVGVGGGLANCQNLQNVTSLYNYAEGDGGGMKACTPALDCVLAYNYSAAKGGGANDGTLTNCVLKGNVSGSGGGMYGGTAVGSIFTDNANSSVEATALIGCDIDTSPIVSVPLADRCVLHEISNKSDLMKAVGNVAYPNGKVNVFTYVINGATVMRNCLVTNCYAQGNSSYNDNTMFTGGFKTRVENCTFDKNSYRNFVRYAENPDKPIAFVNCAINGAASFLNTAYMSLSNCVYKSITSKSDWPEGFGPKGCKTSSDMKFLGTGEYPYTPKRKSPLIGYGQVLDWMREDGSVDLAGNPMLKPEETTAVDVGAYQCWIQPLGIILIVR